MHRCVTSPIRKRLAGACLALGVFLATGMASAQTAENSVSLTLPQARLLAGHALETGQPALALRLSAGLVKANPKDPVAHYMQALAYAGLNRNRDGRRAAARAYRLTDISADRMRAAELAAKLSYAEGRPTLAQIWLRRTAIHAESEEVSQQIARDYRILRQRNPWSFSVNAGLRPSDNVNNGSSSRYNTIDGEPDYGLRPADAVALSGVIATLDTMLGYRLRGDRQSATYLLGRLYISRVTLSDSAEALAPGVSGRKYGSTYGELTLRHAFAIGAPREGNFASVSASLGESRFGGDRNFYFARLFGDRTWALSEASSLTLGVLAEDRFKAKSKANDARVYGLSAVFDHRLQGGNRLGLSLSLRDVSAQAMNGTYSGASLRGTVTFDKRLGPARVSAGLALGATDYPLIAAGLNAFGRVVFAPRDDKTIAGDLTFFFEEYDYAGFAPTLTLQASKTDSNISIYSARDFSLALGIKSTF